MKKIHYICYILLLNFLLGIHNGYVALWENGNTQPVQVYDVPAKNLPAADQAALKKGIAASDEAALQRMLEDYLS